jgi:hypothetical protein
VYLKATTGRTNHGTEIIFSKPIIIDIVHSEKTQRYRYKSKQFSVQNLIKDDASYIDFLI